jgi:hypothetical protein
MQVVKAESQKEPLILFIRNVEKSIIGNFERYMKLESLKENRLVVIGSHTLDQHKDKGHSISSISTKGGHNVTALLDLSFLVGLSVFRSTSGFFGTLSHLCHHSRLVSDLLLCLYLYLSLAPVNTSMFE